MSTEGDRNKIAQTLSAADLQAFVEECYNTPQLTLAKIQELAGTRGISISLMGATSFRDTTFKRHMERIRRAKELAEQLGELRKTGGSIADAAADILSHEVMDALTNRDPDEPLDLDVMTKVVKRLRDGDRLRNESEKKLEMAEARLREYEEKEAERKVKAEAARAALNRSKKGLTPETIKQVEEALGLV